MPTTPESRDRTAEVGVTEGEDSAVTSHFPVPPAVGGDGHAD